MDAGGAKKFTFSTLFSFGQLLQIVMSLTFMIFLVSFSLSRQVSLLQEEKFALQYFMWGGIEDAALLPPQNASSTWSFPSDSYHMTKVYIGYAWGKFCPETCSLCSCMFLSENHQNFPFLK